MQITAVKMRVSCCFFLFASSLILVSKLMDGHAYFDYLLVQCARAEHTLEIEKYLGKAYASKKNKNLILDIGAVPQMFNAASKYC